MSIAVLCPGQGKSAELSQIDIVEASLASYPELVAGTGPNGLAFVGLSLGEWTAMCLAGVLTKTDVLRLVVRRQELMDEACGESPGKMAAIIGLDNIEVESICEEIGGVWPANYLPGQLVISGLIVAVDEAVAIARDKGARARELQTRGAYHTPLMEPANTLLVPLLNKVAFSPPTSAIYSTVSGERVCDPLVAKQLLMRQMVAPVRLEAAMRAMILDGVTEPVELEPSGVLAKLFHRVIIP